MGVGGWRGRFAQNLVIMLAQQGSRAANVPPRFFELVGRAQMGQCPGLGVGHVNKKIAGFELFLLGHGFHGQYRGKTDPTLLAGLEEVLDCPALHPLVEIGLEHVPVLGANKGVFEYFPTRPLWIPHEINQALPLVLLHRHHKDQAVLTLIHAPGIDQAAAQPRRHLTHIGVVDKVLFQEGGDKLLNRKIDMLTLAGFVGFAIGGQARHSRSQPTLKVGLMAGRFERG